MSNKKVINFIYKNKTFYEDYFHNNRLSKCNYGYTCDIDQIYCYLNLIDIKKTVYFDFYNVVNAYFDIDNMNLLEVTCGYIPILSAIYKNNGINIDAINNKILIKNYRGINTIEYDLNKPYDLSKYDLIIGIRPCYITENIIDNCYKYKKDFILYLCPCVHNSKDGKVFDNYKNWINYLKFKTSNFANYNIKFEYFDFFPDKCPVIIGKCVKH